MSLLIVLLVSGVVAYIVGTRTADRVNAKEAAERNETQHWIDSSR